jgi:hypothetical protein
MPHDVFISHSSKDKAVANAICTALEAAGIKCWIAPRNINPGQEWPEAIVKAVTSSRAMVLVFSKNANHSRDVAKETLMAMNTGIDLIPIKIEESEPTGTMQYYLAGSKWINAAEQPVEEKTEELLQSIRPLIPVVAATAETEEQPLQSEGFSLKAIISKIKHFISTKPVLAAVLAIACLLLIGAIGILSADHERAEENESDTQALPAALDDHEDYDLKISGLDYKAIYIIDNVNGTIPLADLEIGSRVVDPSWLWQFRTGANYSYIEGDKTKPVVWIVVARDHYNNMEPHVTLLTQELIGKIAFDNSKTPRVRIGTYQSDQQVHLGSNNWGTSGTISATYGLRPWLNSTGIHANEGFYRAFSDSFKKSIAVTTALPNLLWEDCSLYTTRDMVFISSSIELGNTAYADTFQAERSYPFFLGSEAADRVAKIGNENCAYWTRSPNLTDSYNLYCVISSGGFMKTNYAYYNHYAVRAAVNLKFNTMVYELTK